MKKTMAKFLSFLLIGLVAVNPSLLAGRKHTDVDDIGNRKINGRIAGIFPNFG